MSVCSHIERSLREPLESIGSPHSPVTNGGAVGAALFPEDGDEAEGLLKSADRAMYADKHRGEGAT